MTDVAIAKVSSNVVIGEGAVTPAGASGPPDFHSMEVSRLKDLLRPIIVDLLGEELSRARRMRS
jgi:hypothetical protein